MIKVLVGEFTGYREPLIEKLGWGRLYIARDRYIMPYPGEPWGFDNGAYRDYLRGESFNENIYRRSLERALSAAEVTPPLLCVLPDIVLGGQQSLDLSLKWLDKLPSKLPWYLSVQNGMTCEDIEPYMNRLAGIFLGGDIKFKATAPIWARFAHSHGKQFHYARCSTPSRLEHARESGADSIDGTSFQREKNAWDKFIYHWQHQPQLKLWQSLPS